MSYLDEINARYSATKMFPGNELNQMRSMLDDPNVSAENKTNFLYALSNVEQISDEDIDEYAGQIGADADDIKDGGEAPAENLANAKASIPAARNDQRVGKEKGDVKNAQSNLNSGGGYGTSDEIVTEGEKALKLFDEFHPRFQKAGGQDDAAGGAGKQDRGVVTTDSAQGKSGGDSASAGYSKSGVDPRSLREGMAEFKGIDFNAFRADAQTLSEADGAVNDANEQLNQAWGANTSEWTGDAKSAAEERNNTLVTGGGDLSQALNTAPGDITNTIDNCVQKNVINFAQQVLELYGDGKIAQLTPQKVDQFLKAKDELPPVIKELDDKIKDMDDSWLSTIGNALTLASPLVGILGYQIPSAITEDNIEEETEKLKGILNDANEKLKQFCDDYKTKANSIHQNASEFVQGIQENYDSLIEALNKGMDPDPFAQQGGAQPGADDAAKRAQSSAKVDTGAGGTGNAGDADTGGSSAGATGAAGAPTGGSGAGGGDAGSGSGGVTAPQGAGGQQEEQGKAEPGMNPVTGKPVETDPKTGEPYPIDPETGEPVKDGTEHQDAMTVHKGANKIGLAEPGPDGKMGISVDDGSGQPKELNLEFGDGQQGPPAGTGPDPGPQEAQPPQQGAPGDEVHKPGPDGKIHITEGGLEITAERPEGPDGPTTVTIDDGSGEPATYTLGEQAGTDGPGSVTGQDAAAGAGTEPASADGLFGGGEPGAGGEAPAAGLGDTGTGGGANAPAAGLGDTGADADTGSGAPGGTTGGGEGGSALGEAAAADGTDQPPESGTLSGSIAPEPETAGVGVAPGGGADPGAAASAQAGGGEGGMPMMAGAGGAAGGDQDRGMNPYRVDGGLFEGSGGQRISGSLDDQRDQPVRYER